MNIPLSHSFRTKNTERAVSDHAGSCVESWGAHRIREGEKEKVRSDDVFAVDAHECKQGHLSWTADGYDDGREAGIGCQRVYGGGVGVGVWVFYRKYGVTARNLELDSGGCHSYVAAAALGRCVVAEPDTPQSGCAGATQQTKFAVTDKIST